MNVPALEVSVSFVGDCFLMNDLLATLSLITLSSVRLLRWRLFSYAMGRLAITEGAAGQFPSPSLETVFL